jgi:glycosyltransferase involved in cell wall biosynthesis
LFSHPLFFFNLNLDLSTLKICFLAGTLGQGGAERQLFYNLRALKESGAQLQLFCLTRGEYWEEPLRQIGVPAVWIGQSQSRMRRLSKLIMELKRNPPAIIQSQHFYTNIYVAAAARLLGLREIGALRNDGVSEIASVGQMMGKLSLRWPRTVAANSRAAIEKAIGLGAPADRLCLLNNVVDTDHFSPAARTASEIATIAAIGRLVPQKRFDRLLSVVARLRSRTVHPFKVVIVGDGPLRAQLTEQALKSGLEGVVELRGATPDPRSVYGEADILLLTSDWEGSPNVVLEAMASGLPVVATAVGSAPELIRERVTGFIAPPTNEEKLVAALLELLHNRQLREEMGRKARQDVLAEHSTSQLPHRLQKLYEAVLA